MAGVPDKVFWSDPDIKLGGNTNDNLVPLMGRDFFIAHSMQCSEVAENLGSPSGELPEGLVQANWIFRSVATRKSSETPFRAKQDEGAT